jgi:hypothetical protein
MQMPYISTATNNSRPRNVEACWGSAVCQYVALLACSDLNGPSRQAEAGSLHLLAMGQELACTATNLTASRQLLHTVQH